MKPLRIAITYCGGCNPLYDRIAEVEKLKARLPGHAILVQSPEDTVDLVVAVQGCPTACADASRFQGTRVMIIRNPEDFEKLGGNLNLP